MELNEAIAYYEKEAEEQELNACNPFEEEENRAFYQGLAKRNKQTAVWLEELAERREADRWISIKTRPLTEEEKQNAIEEHGIDPDDLEYPFAWHFDCELPKLKEGEQSVDVLVTTALGFVKVTNFFIDYLGCPCFEDMDEASEFVAWMPLPKAYESEADHD